MVCRCPAAVVHWVKEGSTSSEVCKFSRQAAGLKRGSLAEEVMKSKLEPRVELVRIQPLWQALEAELGPQVGLQKAPHCSFELRVTLQPHGRLERFLHLQWVLVPW